MENLLDYVIYALLGHNYEVKRTTKSSIDQSSQWLVTFESEVRLIFDEGDVRVFRHMIETSKDTDTIERISKLLSYFV